VSRALGVHQDVPRMYHCVARARLCHLFRERQWDPRTLFMTRDTPGQRDPARDERRWPVIGAVTGAGTRRLSQEVIDVDVQCPAVSVGQQGTPSGLLDLDFSSMTCATDAPTVAAGMSNRITPIATSPNRTRLPSVVVHLLLQLVVLDIPRTPSSYRSKERQWHSPLGSQVVRHGVSRCRLLTPKGYYAA
jgi:hypothetical protein